MLIFDAHLDLAWNALDWDRDLRLPVAEIRRREQGLPGKGRGRNTVSFPELRRGRVVTFLATLLPRRYYPGQIPSVRSYQAPEAAYAAAQGQLAYYRILEKQGVLRRIEHAAALQQHTRAWQQQEDSASEPLGYILSMEGTDAVLFPEQVQEWWQAGLRVLGLAHYGVSPYAHGTGTEGGLLPQGPALLRQMERVGLILDVTHLADRALEEALDQFGGPVLASHHNCRALVPDQRQLSDAQLRRLLDRGAVLGAALDAWMLHPGWVRGQTTPEEVDLRLERVLDHIDHVCQLAGNAQQAGLGSDLDGGFGTEQTPRDLDTIADLQRLPELLERRGYRHQDIENILYGNWLRFFTQAWTALPPAPAPGS
jgi:membrane dipeptidase